MLVSDIIAIQHQDIKDVDSADFSLRFPLQKVVCKLTSRTVCCYFSFFYSSSFLFFWQCIILFQRESTFPDTRSMPVPCSPLCSNTPASKNRHISTAQLSQGRERKQDHSYHHQLSGTIVPHQVAQHKAQCTTASSFEVPEDSRTPRQQHLIL